MPRANLLQSMNHYLGDPDRLTWSLDRYRGASPETVRAAAASTLALEHKVVIVTQPAAPAAAPTSGGGK
jgi:hypothetical protein